MTRRPAKTRGHFAVRLSRKQRRDIELAASTHGQDIGAFVLDAALRAAGQIVQPQEDHPIDGFTVLCRIDAYADYVTEVVAGDAESAAFLARENHGDYVWRVDGVHEFDARLYVTLNDDGREMEETQISDF